MNPSARDQTKRNRNIGTRKQGHGKNNSFAIPQPADTSKYFYERFENAQTTTIMLHNKEVPVIVETLNKGFYYSCTPQDVEFLFNNLPRKDLAGFGLLVFRQPKKKEIIHSSVWGRLIYSMEYKDDFLPSIILEATPERTEFHFTKKQSVAQTNEFELLKKDGLKFELSKRDYVAKINKNLVKSIQLHRTLLHEVGHYVHYLEIVERPSADDEEHEEWEKRQDQYFAIPQREKEAFANNYAVKYKKIFLEKGIIKTTI